MIIFFVPKNRVSWKKSKKKTILYQIMISNCLKEKSNSDNYFWSIRNHLIFECSIFNIFVWHNLKPFSQVFSLVRIFIFLHLWCRLLLQNHRTKSKKMKNPNWNICNSITKLTLLSRPSSGKEHNITR